MDRRQLLLRLGLIIWCGLLVMLCYSTVLQLPLISDDWNQLPYAASRTVTEIWQGATGPAYYRPVAFIVWKVLYVILGRHDEVILHALNVVLFFASSLMVGWLAGRLWAPADDEDHFDWRRCYVSAGLFALFPFSYDALAWIAAMMHPLAIALLLLSVISYVKARKSGSWLWSGLGLAAALLSPLVHENGALAGPLIMMIELTWPRTTAPLWRRLSRAALWLVPMLIWWLIWRSVPIARGPESLALNDARTLWRNSVYFLQGPAYPITWAGGWLSENLALDNVGVAISLSVIALAGAALIQWRARADRRAWLPWLWIGVTSAPIVLFLNYTYVSSSPRMMMLMSVGAAWLWTDVGLRLADWGRATITRQRLGPALAVVLAVALMIQNVAFIRDRLQPWELAGAVIRQIVDHTVAANAQGELAVFINLPAWIAPPQVMLAVGQNGVGLLSTYYPLESIISAYTGQAGRAASLKIEAIQSKVPYYIGLRDSTTNWSSLAKSGGRIFMTYYAPDKAIIQPVGMLSVTALSSQPIARFDQQISLLEASATTSVSGLHIDLLWQVTQPPADDVTIFVHVLDADGQLIAQADGDPLAGSYPFAQWPNGLIVRDVRSTDVTGSGLSVYIGLYRRSTGERLIATSVEGALFADNAVPIAVR
jgi:hypothetical protein